jgi:CRISPR-associated protein Cmr3
MSVAIMHLTPRDPIIARDGRPFGVGQGNRMRGLAWPLPSVIAGSFRTALVKANLTLDFAGEMSQRLMAIEVAGVFPVHTGELYLPAANDAVAEPVEAGQGIKTIHRAAPQSSNGSCDFPDDLPLRPVMLPEAQAASDFKPAEVPTWWPVGQMTRWLVGEPIKFDKSFLGNPLQELRDHVCLDADRGAAAEGQIFATAGLNVAYLPKFEEKRADTKSPFADRFAGITLSARVTFHEADFDHLGLLKTWHPLGGERRLIHWHCNGDASLWTCPEIVKQALAGTTQVRMVLATPAIFKHGWKPGWLANGLEGELHGVKLKLVGVSNGRWKAVSGWSLAPPRGPKPIRRMVPAGSVYFFECKPGEATPLADHWLKSVSDDEQERRDGFGLAIWGTW